MEPKKYLEVYANFISLKPLSQIKKQTEQIVLPIKHNENILDGEGASETESVCSSEHSTSRTTLNLRKRLESCHENRIEPKEENFDLDYESSCKRLKEEELIIKDENEDEVDEFPSLKNYLIEKPVNDVNDQVQNEISEDDGEQLEYDSLGEDSDTEEQSLHVWDYFTKSIVLHRAVCIYCKADYTDCGSTTRLWIHLNEHHKDKIVEPKKEEYINSYYEFILGRNASGVDNDSKSANVIWNYFERIQSQRAACVFCSEICVANNNDTNVFWNHLLNNHEDNLVLHVLDNSSQYLQGYHQFLSEYSNEVLTGEKEKYTECQSKILQHYNRTSEECQDAVCVYCGKTYTNRNTETLWNHLLDHYKQKIGMIHNKKLLRSFIFSLMEETNIVDKAVCVYCQVAFNLTVNTTSDLKLHLKSHHEMVSKNDVRISIPSEEQIYEKSVVSNHFSNISRHFAKCNYCKCEFSSINKISVTPLKRHLQRKHGDVVTCE